MNYGGMTANGVVNDSGDVVALALLGLPQSATSGLPDPGTETEE